MLILIGFVLVALALEIGFLLTLHLILRRSGDQRTMSAGLVWLNLVPIFNLAWQFYTVLQVSESLKRSFQYHYRTLNGDGGKSLGFAWALLTCFLLLPVPIAQIMAFFVVGIVWTLYWAAMLKYSRQLKQMVKSRHCP